MVIIEIYDRPLCCSTGICGPSVDPSLVQFAADLDWLKGQGVSVHRYNLAFEPGAFTQHDDVKDALRIGQVAALPLVRVDGRLVSQSHYPTREEMSQWCGLTGPKLEMAQAAPNCCEPGACC